MLAKKVIVVVQAYNVAIQCSSYLDLTNCTAAAIAAHKHNTLDITATP